LQQRRGDVAEAFDFSAQKFAVLAPGQKRHRVAAVAALVKILNFAEKTTFVLTKV
jgi:hypothetical protein